MIRQAIAASSCDGAMAVALVFNCGADRGGMQGWRLPDGAGIINYVMFYLIWPIFCLVYYSYSALYQLLCISYSRFPQSFPFKNVLYFSLYTLPSPQFGLKSGYSQHVGLSQLYVI